jgi:hypothetical protein
MKKFSIVGALLSMCLLPSLSHASAVLIDARGGVAVKLAGGEAAKAVPGLELPDGSTVAVEKGGKASVLLEGGAVDEIASGSRYTVGPKAEGEKRTELGGGIAVAMRELAASGSGPTVHGMVREARGPTNKLPDLSVLGKSSFVALFPEGTAVRLGDAIAFRWSGAPAGLASPVVVIDDAQKKHLAVKPIVLAKGEFSAAPKTLGIAKGSTYSWYVGEGLKSPTGKTARFEFTTLSAAQEKALDGELAIIRQIDVGAEGRALLLGQAYYEYKMFDELVRVLEPAIQKTSNSFGRKLLSAAYSRMGRVEEAKKYK